MKVKVNMLHFGQIQKFYFKPHFIMNVELDLRVVKIVLFIKKRIIRIRVIVESIHPSSSTYFHLHTLILTKYIKRILSQTMCDLIVVASYKTKSKASLGTNTINHNGRINVNSFRYCFRILLRYITTTLIFTSCLLQGICNN